MTTTPALPLLDELDELDELRAKATPGPWRVPYPFTKLVDVPGREASITSESAADAALIVAAVNRLPELTAALRAVLELADNLTSYVAARGLPAPGTYDDGVNRAQSAVAADLRAAITTALEASS